MIESVSSFTTYWSKARGRTMRVLDHIPESDLEWSYSPDHFTFGDLFRHLAGIERFMYAENVAGRPSRYPGHASELASGLSAVRSYVERCHNDALAIFNGLSDSDLLQKCMTPGGASISVWKWLRAMVEHESHHRGQLHLMASMRGITLPPLFGLKEEEVFARSQKDR